MKKQLVYGALLLLLISGTAGAVEECQDRVDSDCVILAFTINKTNASHILTGQICNITSYNSSGGLHINNVAMTNGSYGAGYHNWTFSYTTPGIYSSTISCRAGTEYGTGSVVITAVNKTLDTKVDEIIPAIQSVNQTCKTQPEDNPGWIFSLSDYYISPLFLQQNGIPYNSMREVWSFERSYSRR